MTVQPGARGRLSVPIGSTSDGGKVAPQYVEIDVRILAVHPKRFGVVRVEVEPVAGEGRAKINLDRIRMEQTL